MQVNATLANAWANDTLAAINAGTGPGKVKVYDVADVLLGTVTCSDPAGTVTGRVLTFDPFTQDDSADASGDANYAVVTDSDDGVVGELTVTATGGGGQIQLNDISITAGMPIQINSGTITF